MSGLVTRLQKQAERGTYIPDGPKLILEAIAEIESLRSRLAEAERDAARYRWLRQAHPGDVEKVVWLADTQEEVDASVDSYINRQKAP